MNNKTHGKTEFRKLVNRMVDERRRYAAANNFTVTDEEIAQDIAIRLVEMMKAAGR